MTVRKELVSGLISPLAANLAQVSGFPPISVWRMFRLLEIRLGAGRTAESTRVRLSAEKGLSAAVVWAVASPVLFPIKAVEVTAREIQREDRRSMEERSGKR